MLDPAEARRLLDAHEIDRLLALVTAEEVGQAWCRYAARTSTAERHDWAADPDGWAAELYYESEFLANEAFVRDFLVAIAEAAPEEVLGWVGAGPLEDFIKDDRDRVAWVEEQAARSARFRRALGNVWIDNAVSHETLLRIERAAGVELARSEQPRLGG